MSTKLSISSLHWHSSYLAYWSCEEVEEWWIFSSKQWRATGAFLYGWMRWLQINRTGVFVQQLTTMKILLLLSHMTTWVNNSDSHLESACFMVALGLFIGAGWSYLSETSGRKKCSEFSSRLLERGGWPQLIQELSAGHLIEALFIHFSNVTASFPKIRLNVSFLFPFKRPHRTAISCMS
jgi:hypothetical protein